MARTTKVPVTLRALVQRINRALKKDDQILRASRGAWRGDVGAFYIVDTRRNVIAEKDVDAELLGGELGVLAPYEEVRYD